MGEAGGAGPVIDGGAKMRVRDARGGDISDEQVETFFITLAETCNVVRSARAAGFSANWAYRKRRRDAGFRAGWAKAVREGYAKLELVLLERAMKGTVKAVGTGGNARIIREYSTALAVALLRRHADTADEAGYEDDSDELRETRERILAKLERVRLRDAGEESPLTPLACGESPSPSRGEGKIETKGAVDRVEIIRWALRRVGGHALTPLAFGESPASGEDRSQRSSGRPGDDRPDAPVNERGK
jgi:hypothetical protein